VRYVIGPRKLSGKQSRFPRWKTWTSLLTLAEFPPANHIRQFAWPPFRDGKNGTIVPMKILAEDQSFKATCAICRLNFTLLSGFFRMGCS